MHVDPIKLVPPDYGIDWKFSHGFGIGQITCGGGTKEQPDCRKDGNAGCLVGGVCYTVPELLTINLSPLLSSLLLSINKGFAPPEADTSK